MESSSLSRDQTQASSLGSVESQPLDNQGSPKSASLEPWASGMGPAILGKKTLSTRIAQLVGYRPEAIMDISWRELVEKYERSRRILIDGLSILKPNWI